MGGGRTDGRTRPALLWSTLRGRTGIDTDKTVRMTIECDNQ